MKRLSVLFVMALVGMLLPLAALAPEAVGATPTVTDLPVITPRAMAVDPTTGRVFVSGDEKVVVFDADGGYRTTINGLSGAQGMAVDGPDLWVADTTADELARIDIATSTVVARYDVGIVGPSLAVVDGAVWFTLDGGGFWKLVRLDPPTATVEDTGITATGGRIATIPGSTTHLLFYETGVTGSSIYRVDIGADPVVVDGETDPTLGGYLGEVAATPNGTFVTASSSPYEFDEYSLATMTPTGLIYPGSFNPDGIAYTSGAGGVLVGSTRATNKVWVAREGVPRSTHVLTPSVAGSIPASTVDVAPDGSRAYVVVVGVGAHLVTFDLTPSIDSVTPAHTVAGVPTTVALNGNGLGAATGVSVGGVPAFFTIVSPTELSVEVPTTLGPGAHPVSVATPFGAVAAGLSVASNTGATLRGVVGEGSVPILPTTTTTSPAVVVSDIELTLSGGGLSAPVTVTSGADGAYAFTGLPYGSDYELSVHDPSGVYGDQLLGPLTLVPNDSSELSVDLLSPPPESPGSVLARVGLPPGTARAVVFDPGSSRVFVSVGDEVVAFDRDGNVLKRFQQQWSADGLALGGGFLYVDQRTAGVIAKIDTTTLDVVATFPTGYATDGAIAFAGGRLWFTAGTGARAGAATMDPTAGSVSPTSCPGICSDYPRFGPVSDAPNLLLTWDNSTPARVSVADASSPPPSVLASNPPGTVNVPTDVVGSARSDRVWAATGTEFDLTTMNPTGVQYPASGIGAVAHSDGSGGVLVFGHTVVHEGNPQATHVLDDDPVTRGVALDDSGERVFLADAAGELVVYDLAPRAKAVTWSGVDAVAISGEGLGGATDVLLDGASVSFSASPTSVAVTLPALTPGTHSLEVVTPWGTTDPVSFQFPVVPPPPTVTGISPNAGPMTGGTSVTVFGSAFSDVVAVRVDGVGVPFHVVSPTKLTFVAPPHPDGTGAVEVETAQGSSGTGVHFLWYATQVFVTGVSPDRGPSTGGTPITLTGSGFSFATSVMFGSTPASSFDVVSDTEIQAVAPAESTGTVDVAVTTAGGTNDTGPASRYQYLGGDPFGSVDVVSGGPDSVHVAGWAIDPDTYDPIDVAVWVDGVGANFAADQARPDVGAVFGYGANHGFDAVMAVSPGVHSVCVAAYNVGVGSTRWIRCQSGVVVAGGDPFGWVDVISGGPGSVHVAGWAIDPDTYDPIHVTVSVDGVGVGLLADRSRPDVGSAFGYGADHGFDQLVAASPGVHRVCVWASNVGVGSSRTLRCQTVTTT